MAEDERLLSRLTNQNPWWISPGAIESDPQLRELELAPIAWEPPLLHALDLGRPSVYTIRGPRQVGKTTLLKLLIRRSLTDGHPPGRVLFYSLDIERDPADIVDVVRLAKLQSKSRGRWRIFLDEVSSVPGWQRGVKYLRDQTDAREDCFVLTGSSSIDIRSGGERLPGRRGPGARLDKVMLPMSFREFCLVRGLEPPIDAFTIREILDKPQLVGPLLARTDALDRSLQAYARVGGFPRAVRGSVDGRPPGLEVVETLWAVIAGDVDRAGRDRVSAMRILERVVRSLGSPISWTSMARDADLASSHTAQANVQFLAESYVLLVLYALQIGRGTAARKRKKLYLTDPLLAHLPHALDPGAPEPGTPGLVENVVAVTLFRHLEQEPTESFGLPTRLHHWASTSGREIDFVGRTGRLQIPVEVKYRGRVTGKDRESIWRSFGRGIVLSRRSFDLDGPVPVIPAGAFLASITVAPPEG